MHRSLKKKKKSLSCPFPILFFSSLILFHSNSTQQPKPNLVKLLWCPQEKRRTATSPKHQRDVFLSFSWTLALSFLFHFPQPKDIAREVHSFTSELRKMDDRAILKQNQNNKMGNKRTAHPAGVGESCHNWRSFRNVSCWASPAPEKKWKEEDGSKRLFSWNKAHTAKDEATIWRSSGNRL